MGKQSKINKTRRIRKKIGDIIEKALDSGKLVEKEDGYFKFEDPVIAQ